MKISDMGEETFVQNLAERFKVDFPLIGIGDDCAVIPTQEGNLSWLVTTDAFIEGVHFLSSTLSSENVGHKAVMVNVSDIAAMGGKPLYAFLSLGLPKNMETNFLDGFLKGFEEALAETHVKLMGGDTVHSLSHVFINVTLIGQAATKNIKRRSFGKIGDIICVDGPLGDSAAGLDLLLHDFKRSKESKFLSLLDAHRRPRAHIREGEWLSHREGVHAMMDLSDGVFIDLPRLLQASECGAHIYLEKLPLSQSFKEYCKEKERDPYKLAIEGGEEYCLLFTVSHDQFNSLKNEFNTHFDRTIYPIGTLTSEKLITRYFFNGKPELLQASPYRHF